MRDIDLQDLMFALLGVGLSLDTSFLVVIPTLPVGNGNVSSLPLFIETLLVVFDFIDVHK